MMNDIKDIGKAAQRRSKHSIPSSYYTDYQEIEYEGKRIRLISPIVTIVPYATDCYFRENIHADKSRRKDIRFDEKYKIMLSIHKAQIFNQSHWADANEIGVNTKIVVVAVEQKNGKTKMVDDPASKIFVGTNQDMKSGILNADFWKTNVWPKNGIVCRSIYFHDGPVGFTKEWSIRLSER